MATSHPCWHFNRLWRQWLGIKKEIWWRYTGNMRSIQPFTPFRHDDLKVFIHFFGIVNYALRVLVNINKLSVLNLMHKAKLRKECRKHGGRWTVELIIADLLAGPWEVGHNVCGDIEISLHSHQIMSCFCSYRSKYKTLFSFIWPPYILSVHFFNKYLCRKHFHCQNLANLILQFKGNFIFYLIEQNTKWI